MVDQGDEPSAEHILNTEITGKKKELVWEIFQ